MWPGEASCGRADWPGCSWRSRAQPSSPQPRLRAISRPKLQARPSGGHTHRSSRGQPISLTAQPRQHSRRLIFSPQIGAALDIWEREESSSPGSNQAPAGPRAGGSTAPGPGPSLRAADLGRSVERTAWQGLGRAPRRTEGAGRAQGPAVGERGAGKASAAEILDFRPPSASVNPTNSQSFQTKMGGGTLRNPDTQLVLPTSRTPTEPG
ncbi:uncharacterized protein LOC125079788 [Lutra lutra]|uniref:uncharacterized protein LOC125079788 n=1 Tax=Lutra lutra TaxID=9657 RepID=UPI001FD48963|nr:uncharacterized protein LOC125079788 [Lutra lutra]